MSSHLASRSPVEVCAKCQSCPTKFVGLVRGNLVMELGTELPIRGGSLDLRLHYNCLGQRDPERAAVYGPSIHHVT